MNRETQILNVNGHDIVVKTYATAREVNLIQQSYFKGSKVEVLGDQPKISEFNPGVQFEVEKEIINQLVISVDGQTDKIVDTVIDWPIEDYRALVTQLDALVSKKK